LFVRRGTTFITFRYLEILYIFKASSMRYIYAKTLSSSFPVNWGSFTLSNHNYYTASGAGNGIRGFNLTGCCGSCKSCRSDGSMSIHYEEGVQSILGGNTSCIGIQDFRKCGKTRGHNKGLLVDVHTILLSAEEVGVHLVNRGMLLALWTARASTNICGSLSIRRS
jgi:hypothetical protein